MHRQRLAFDGHFQRTATPSDALPQFSHLDRLQTTKLIWGSSGTEDNISLSVFKNLQGDFSGVPPAQPTISLSPTNFLIVSANGLGMYYAAGPAFIFCSLALPPADASKKSTPCSARRCANSTVSSVRHEGSSGRLSYMKSLADTLGICVRKQLSSRVPFMIYLTNKGMVSGMAARTGSTTCKVNRIQFSKFPPH